MNIKEMFNLRPAAGAIGLEIEVEGERLSRGGELPLWNVVGDGSLNDGLEYVLAKPLGLGGVSAALQQLKESFTRNNTRLIQSARTSVHVHINVQMMTPKEVYSFITAYLVIEDVLTRFCGKEREGNLFCLRARDAEYMVDVLVSSVRRGNMDSLGDDNHRYAALNLCALHRFGSLEFRAMRGDVDFDTIKDWASMLLLLRNSAKKFNNPQDIIRSFSEEGGGEAFLRSLVGKRADLLIPLCPDLDDLLHSGMRNAQDVAYAIPSWDEL